VYNYLCILFAFMGVSVSWLTWRRLELCFFFLTCTGLETKGLFRRAGSKAKVDLLRAVNEANPGSHLPSIILYTHTQHTHKRTRMFPGSSPAFVTFCTLRDKSWGIAWEQGQHTRPHTHYVYPLFSSPSDNNKYEGFSVYDISDMIKLYFRELPEPLLTTKFSEILLVIHESKWQTLGVVVGVVHPGRDQ